MKEIKKITECFLILNIFVSCAVYMLFNVELCMLKLITFSFCFC